MDEEELTRSDEEAFLEEEEDLLESEALVPEKEAEMEWLAARDSLSGARDDDEEECREGILSTLALFRPGG